MLTITPPKVPNLTIRLCNFCNVIKKNKSFKKKQKKNNLYIDKVQKETNGDCHIGPWFLLLLAIQHYVIFKAPLSTSASQLVGYSTGSPLPQQSAQPLGSALVTASWDWLKTESPKLTLPVSHMGICIYHFITPTHFRSTTWLLLLIFTGASCAENLWLTTQSRVNIQHRFKRLYEIIRLQEESFKKN